LTNSTAYFNTNSTDGGTNNLIRAVFIQDTSPSNVSYKVYFSNLGFGAGDAVIEWSGTFQDPVSGNFFGNFLYLDDDYVLGASTNVVLLNNGYPDNFTFLGSQTQIPLNVTSTPAGFLNVFQPGTITNLYSFANIQLISTTVGLNTVAGGAITNLPGRIQLSVSNDMDLTFAKIT